MLRFFLQHIFEHLLRTLGICQICYVDMDLFFRCRCKSEKSFPKEISNTTRIFGVTTVSWPEILDGARFEHLGQNVKLIQYEDHNGLPNPTMPQ